MRHKTKIGWNREGRIGENKSRNKKERATILGDVINTQGTSEKA